MIASRAADVELKSLSARKKGKEGPVTDNVACSVTGSLFGMKLRTKEMGQDKTVDALIDRLPVLSSRSAVEMTFDRGYGKEYRVAKIASMNFNTVTVASTLGTRHPFITTEEWNKQVAKWKIKRKTDTEIEVFKSHCAAWILDGGEMLGAEVRIAEKTLPANNQKVYALATRDVFDRKLESKDLKFCISASLCQTTQKQTPATTYGTKEMILKVQHQQAESDCWNTGKRKIMTLQKEKIRRRRQEQLVSAGTIVSQSYSPSIV